MILFSVEDIVKLLSKWMDDNNLFFCSPGYGGDSVESGKCAKDFGKYLQDNFEQ